MYFILMPMTDRDADVILNWINCLLKDKFIHTELLRNSIHVKAKKSRVISLVLCHLVLDELLDKIHLHGAYCIRYADDNVIINRGKFKNILLDILNNILKKLEQSCRDVDFSVNPEKIILVAFTKKKSLKFNEIVFYGYTLTCSKEVIFLGVYFNERLCWKNIWITE